MRRERRGRTGASAPLTLSRLSCWLPRAAGGLRMMRAQARLLQPLQGSRMHCPLTTLRWGPGRGCPAPAWTQGSRGACCYSPPRCRAGGPGRRRVGVERRGLQAPQQQQQPQQLRRMPPDLPPRPSLSQQCMHRLAEPNRRTAGVQGVTRRAVAAESTGRRAASRSQPLRLCPTPRHKLRLSFRPLQPRSPRCVDGPLAWQRQQRPRPLPHRRRRRLPLKPAKTGSLQQPLQHSCQCSPRSSSTPLSSPQPLCPAPPPLPPPRSPSLRATGAPPSPPSQTRPPCRPRGSASRPPSSPTQLRGGAAAAGVPRGGIGPQQKASTSVAAPRPRRAGSPRRCRRCSRSPTLCGPQWAQASPCLQRLQGCGSLRRRASPRGPTAA